MDLILLNEENKMSANLRIPNLKLDKMIKMRRTKDNDKRKKELFLYRLEFPTLEDNEQKSFELPEKYKGFDQYLFALDSRYLMTIKCLFKSAQYHWGNPLYKGFNRLMQQSLGNIGVSFINQAFSLLTDCLYDETTEYFSRSKTKHYLKYLFSYYFWGLQSGVSKENQFSYSELDRLEADLTSPRPANIYIKEIKKEIEELINMIRENEEMQLQQEVVFT